jgi:hypothetical protein
MRKQSLNDFLVVAQVSRVFCVPVPEESDKSEHYLLVFFLAIKGACISDLPGAHALQFSSWFNHGESGQA